MPELVAPTNITINFTPSKKQYELWKLLQPNQCPHCGGTIDQVECGVDRDGHPIYKPQCQKCGSFDLPQIILGGGAAGGGKALKLDELVCTPFGFREVGVLKEGDIITNPTTGGTQKIVYMHPIETHDYYRVKFIDGTYIDCSAGHLWNCHVDNDKSKYDKYNEEPPVDKVWKTDVMYEWYKEKTKETYLAIPLTEPVQFTPDNRKPIIAPYILGALIGGGHFQSYSGGSNIVTLTSMDDEIKGRFEEYGYDIFNFVLNDSYRRTKAYSIYSTELIKQLRELGLTECTSKTTFIPQDYKTSTIKDRIALIQGLIYTDSYIDSRGHIIYTTISKQLAEDVAFIVRSLGGIATITQNKDGYKKNGKHIQYTDAYDVQICAKMNHEWCGPLYKKELFTYDFNDCFSKLSKRIVDIEYIGKQEGRCITVDGPSGLFVTNDFTVTHNSYLGSCWIVINCMTFPDLRAVIARKTIKSLKGSTFKTMKNVLREWGLKENVNYKINNLEGVLTFWNGSTVDLIELEDQPSDADFQRLGSNEWSIGMVDEASEVSERAIEVLFSRLRYNIDATFKISRLLLTTNPCITWIRDRFVQDKEGNPVIPREGEAYVPFSVFDNPNKGFVAIYRASLEKITDRATKERLLYGNWNFVASNEAAAYWKFDGNDHLVDGLKEKVYNPLLPVILSFDFNVIPYMSCLAIQIDYDRKKVYVLEEILGKPEEKENNTPKFAQKIRRKYLNEGHTGGLFVTGDPAGLARSTQTEEGVNNFTILTDNLNDPILRPKRKLLTKQPPQTARLEFINELFEKYDGWEILIDMRCRKLTEDLIYQKKNADGTKEKKKVKDPKLGVKYEQYGHLSDCLDYCCCLFLNNAWSHFLSKGGSKIATVNNAPVYGDFNY